MLGTGTFWDPHTFEGTNGNITQSLDMTECPLVSLEAILKERHLLIFPTLCLSFFRMS